MADGEILPIPLSLCVRVVSVCSLWLISAQLFLLYPKRSSKMGAIRLSTGA